MADDTELVMRGPGLGTALARLTGQTLAQAPSGAGYDEAPIPAHEGLRGLIKKYDQDPRHLDTTEGGRKMVGDGV